MIDRLHERRRTLPRWLDNLVAKVFENTNRLRTTVLIVLIVVAFVSSLLGVLLTDWDWGGLLLNLGTEMAGAVATYWLLDLFIGGRERREWQVHIPRGDPGGGR